MRANLDGYIFPPKMTSNSPQPDIVLWSITTSMVLMVELTVSWGEGMEAAFSPKEGKIQKAGICVLSSRLEVKLGAKTTL